MYLKRLEIQGFKSFAHKTDLAFQPGITAIVGPNGSGKSNISDAVRWVLGEQSKLLLRGKRAEDVIFAGSAQRMRSSVAHASVIFDNQDKKLPVDSAEVVITRRLHRDGSSEYLINNEQMRLMDISELLEKAGFAQSRYTVIGQGIIDQFLLQGPAEIKSVIEEAAGLAPFYEKHQKTVRRLTATRENLTQVSALTAEIEPRLRTLRRQAKKLEQRSEIEKQWKDLLSGRLLFIFANLQKDKSNLTGQINELETKIKQLEGAVQKFFRSVEESDQNSTKRSQTITALQQSIVNEQRQKERLQLELAELRVKMGANLSNPQKDLAALHGRRDDLRRQQAELSSQVEDFEKNILETEQDIKEIVDILNSSKPDLVPRFNQISDRFLNNQKQLIKKMISQKQDLARAIARIEAEIGAGGSDFQEAADKLDKIIQVHEKSLNKLQADLQNELTNISAYTSGRQEADKKIRKEEQDLNRLRSEQNNFKIELARIETKQEEEERSATEDLGANFKEIIKGTAQVQDAAADEQISYLKRQLEQIGGLDEQTAREYEETEERYSYLTGQVRDLEAAATDLETVLEELNAVIKEKFNEAFSIISAKFSDYFRVLFNGGKADLKKIKNQISKIKNEDGTDEEDEEEQEKKIEPNQDIIGIDISATPPGKKLSSISALSGGERTLTTIALLIALLDAYPSPFVVLDEVDAALDESNSIRFAKILGTLSDRTQFITITHNRETMRRAHTLYGVTMNDSGVSQILSIKFDDSLTYAQE
ncbi:MAG: hypothetical protein A3J48_02525 [Candidatus Doudnabacteria bacterium RIFCSPHIGHO2_02_FULL_46_11]|uniref:RecF/RecN/SMC N-terminal domain-containing protein n=1 Tax=Candidatus Doudnabacteria bacterium RIFCSPHIGHO2_02_FULL_46_11 TaxID=1817832 RepID=A0A1F5P9K5_9BACT|nr:MAG: hypothetical protein A3J48_02525 [Candidatus Doudnabacteria bacterium RIFCSPHIGHO2_02_FULL_46_11]